MCARSSQTDVLVINNIKLDYFLRFSARADVLLQFSNQFSKLRQSSKPEDSKNVFHENTAVCML
jgi:hypothetical protein